ncbi:hypothetical protein EQU06_00360 [Lactobacillus sanfranciscensis]|uniref:Uncharacterized protein n=2 Tax=Fructilactobacillus sanfranciscensis TaxID=1625 RepID=G2KWI1_FRUST|nr:hypothetical protein [Fructilactobacillus sanfranciscensis]AEN99375.1 hypothetical protein LSA_09750 [Fructilactobacillus sanfranciscensis TMW 1.1304]NDR75429.1 hypothetical protein [Fructilactobacillus sanfranciscensis]NDR95995.1 hypothetical protein [Fructilactobacillus sanfranciscensis]NDS03862.1 hypothetical protein [Fructilactobacillus sanfranciscensis]POH20336.1 hypothetical protein BGL44_00390 [Fructilactobacillus sanfranciscensis]
MINEELNEKMKILRKSAAKASHNKIGKRNRSGIVGVTKLVNRNQDGREYIYWQASINVKGKQYLKCFKENERKDAIIQRGLWEQNFLVELQPSIKAYVLNYLKLNNDL